MLFILLIFLRQFSAVNCAIDLLYVWNKARVSTLFSHLDMFLKSPTKFVPQFCSWEERKAAPRGGGG